MQRAKPIHLLYQHVIDKQWSAYYSGTLYVEIVGKQLLTTLTLLSTSQSNKFQWIIGPSSSETFRRLRLEPLNHRVTQIYEPKCISWSPQKQRLLTFTLFFLFTFMFLVILSYHVVSHIAFTYKFILALAATVILPPLHQRVDTYLLLQWFGMTDTKL